MRPLGYEMDLAVPRDRVWDAWATGEGLASWACSRARVDPVLGGEWRLSGGLDPDGSEMRLEVRSMDRPRLLDLSVRAAGPDGRELGSTRLEVRLVPTLDGTRVEVRHSGFGESGDWMWLRSRFERYWWSALEALRVALA
jgi:uncharacterized protein YndB with AHSA1/START domain